MSGVEWRIFFCLVPVKQTSCTGPSCPANLATGTEGTELGTSCRSALILYVIGLWPQQQTARNERHHGGGSFFAAGSGRSNKKISIVHPVRYVRAGPPEPTTTL